MSAEQGLIVSVSGIRGIVGQSLTPAAALAFASALAAHTGGGRIVLSRDGRPSGAMLRHAVLAGLTAAGCEVHDLGIAPTPTVGLAVRHRQAAGGIQITASHNPAPWNGLKLFGPDGRVLSAAEGRKVQALFESGGGRRVPWNALGTCTIPRGRGAALQRILRTGRWAAHPRRRTAGRSSTPTAAPADRWAAPAGGAAGRDDLSRLRGRWCLPARAGADRREPARHLSAGRRAARRHRLRARSRLRSPGPDRRDGPLHRRGVDAGAGRAVPSAASERGPLVINMSTSRVTEDLAARHGCACHRSAVGEANVADRMLEVGALLGGEGNGGVIDPRVGLVRDPFIGMGLVLNLMAETGRKLSELVRQSAGVSHRQGQVHGAARASAASVRGADRPLAGGGGQSRWMACVWTGPIAGCTSGRATPSRSCASSLRRRARPMPRSYAGPSGRC
jgi:phosphomannomutase